MKNNNYLTLSLILISFHLSAQYTFITYGEADGLPDKFTRGIAVDEENNLWVGSQKGLVKYDGSTFEHIDLGEAPEYPFVNHVTIAPDGKIWVGYYNQGPEKGVSVYDPGTGDILYVDSIISNEPGNFVNDIVFDQDGVAWIAHGKGITSFDSITWHFMPPASTNYAAAPVHDILFDSDGSMWVGTIFGLSHLKTNGEWEFFSHLFTNLITSNIQTLEKGSDGNLWIGTDKGLSIYNGSDFQNYGTDDGLPVANIQDIAFDEMGRAWLATGNGLTIYDGEIFEHYKTYEHPFIENSITDILIHPELGTWLTTREGLVKVEEGIANSIRPVPESMLNSVLVFPNPAVDYVEIRWKPTLPDLQSIVLFSMAGKLLQRTSVEQNQQSIPLNLASYPAGNYMLLFQTEREVFSKQIVVTE